jgi:hypothetical protein
MLSARLFAQRCAPVHTYGISQDLEGLADDLIVQAGRGDTPFGLYILDAESPSSVLARSIEESVFYETFGNTPDLLAAEYGPYDDASFFVCVVDHLRRRPAGMIRVIAPSPLGFKSLDDLARRWDRPFDQVMAGTGLPVDLDSMWDLATLGVDAEYRGAATSGLVAMALYQGLNMLSHRQGIKWAVAVLDLVVLDLINGAWGRPFAALPGIEPRRYLDSPASQPVLCDAVDYKARLALLDPSTHQILFEGKGLESMVSIPPWSLDDPVSADLAPTPAVRAAG